MRGLILAGGTGTPTSPGRPAPHPLVPVFDKPLIYYPLATLMLAGIREVLVVAPPSHVTALHHLLGDGAHLGMAVHHRADPHPRGAAHAFTVASAFTTGHPVALALGDTLLHGPALAPVLTRLTAVRGAQELAHRSRTPGEFGVVELDRDGHVLAVEDEPGHPRGDHAVPGLAFYDATVTEAATGLRPRPDGTRTATDLHRAYLGRGDLHATRLGPGTAWLDTGRADSPADAAEFVRTVEMRQGHKVGCLEEIAWRQGWIDDAALADRARDAGRTGYGQYLRLLTGHPRDLTLLEPAPPRRTAAR